MIANLFRIKFFFLLCFFAPLSPNSLEYPRPIAKPEIKTSAYKDVFDQIKKQNWSMALAVASDYQNSTLTSYIKWLDITRPGSNHKFDFLVDFYQNHKHWPEKEKIIEKIESSINKSINPLEIINWFKDNPPMSSKGEIDFLESKLKIGDSSQKTKTIKEIWVNKNLTFKQQKYFTRKYSKYWSQEDNWNRFERLIYEGKNISARRTLNRIYGDLRKLGEARLGLSQRSPNVSELINRVPNHLKNDAGLIYERMRWRRKAKLDTAVELLESPPNEIQNVRNWWINSRIVIRRLLNEKKYSKAYRVLKKHNLPLRESSGLEAEWLAGWVALCHLKKPTMSIVHFKNVFENSSDQNIKSKAAYWLALAYEKNDQNEKLIRKWLLESAKNKFTFYGQNAAIRIGSFNFDENNSALKKPFGFDDLFEVIKIIKMSNQNLDKTFPFFSQLIDLSKSIDEKQFVLNIANNVNSHHLTLRLSRKLEVPSLKYSYPLIEDYIPEQFKNSSATLALIHAITHQESNFKINAYSSAGARGLMQLMPYTAKRVARDLRIRYYKSALTKNPQYNVTLGTTYINKMLIKFDQSLPLALAAYNAGPNRVKIWLKRYGDPRSDQIDYLDWIESIPISETRFYVKKVLSNLRIYQKKYGLKLYEVKNIRFGNKFAMPY